MSLEQAAYLAEIFGVFGLIASLIYVGRQVQQATLQMKVEASMERVGIFSGVYFRLAEDRALAELWRKGDREFSGLDATDQFRILSFETAGLALWSHFFHLHELGLLSERVWREQHRDFETVGRREAMREAWKLNKDRFSESFQKFLAKYVE
jgi:hypothetical protein